MNINDYAKYLKDSSKSLLQIAEDERQVINNEVAENIITYKSPTRLRHKITQKDLDDVVMSMVEKMKVDYESLLGEMTTDEIAQVREEIGNQFKDDNEMHSKFMIATYRLFIAGKENQLDESHVWYQFSPIPATFAVTRCRFKLFHLFSS